MHRAINISRVLTMKEPRLADQHDTCFLSQYSSGNMSQSLSALLLHTQKYLHFLFFKEHILLGHSISRLQGHIRCETKLGAGKQNQKPWKQIKQGRNTGNGN